MNKTKRRTLALLLALVLLGSLGYIGWHAADRSRGVRENRAAGVELIEFHRYMISLHKRCPALRRGSLKQLIADKQLIGYGRFLDYNRCVVVINNSSEKREVKIPVWEIGIKDEDTLTRVMVTSTEGYNVGFLMYPVKDGFTTVPLEAYSGILLVSNKKT